MALPLLSQVKVGSTSSEYVFERGNYSFNSFSVDSSSPSKPPKDLYIVSPTAKGQYKVLLFLHGFCLRSQFYCELFQHISSHGFIVLCPQLYLLRPLSGQREIDLAAEVANWLQDHLQSALDQDVKADLSGLYLAGHSRGGKTAFAVALGYAKTALNIKLSKLIGVDPVSGFKGLQTDPKILTFVPHSFNLSIPVTVIGTGLGGESKDCVCPPCAPEGLSHEEFFNECKAPSYQFVAEDYGHMDMLDDNLAGLFGKVADCICKNGKGSREPMRRCVGGIIVAFLMDDVNYEFNTILSHPDCAPVKIKVDSMSKEKESDEKAAPSYAYVRV